MKRTWIAGLMAFVGLVARVDARAADKPAGPKAPTVATKPDGPEKHQAFVAEAVRKNHQVVFFGDSATLGWARGGRDIWKTEFEPLNAAYFGIAAQPVGHLLWRLQNGLLEGYRPRVVVLEIGTANLQAGCPAKDVADGVAACVREIRTRLPSTRVLVMAVAATPLPTFTKAMAAQGAEANRLLAMLDDGRDVRVMDLNPGVRAKKAALLKELLKVGNPYKLTGGYALWAEGIRGPLAEMVK
jgi:GDSL-like lipase/acylhydrolase family protein